MDIDHLNQDLEDAARRLEKDSNYRVLRAVPKPFSMMPGIGAPPDGRCVCIIDLETSGLDSEGDAIIELALMMVFVDNEGAVGGHFGPRSWKEDPGIPLEPEITMLTGLANQHLTGHAIPDAFVAGMLDRADVLVAHNCSFEISWLERRYPSIAGKPWACSMRDIPWLRLGLDGRAQTALLMQHGWFSPAHRAAADVWSLFWMLRESRTGWLKGSPQTHLQRLLGAAESGTVMVQAECAPFSKKDLLRARGYRWNPDGPFWQIELPPQKVEHEQAWGYRNGLPAMSTRTITARERHR
tara:strand:+ start:27314 stop:28204 length:891 start_codon:yes stop_codon:yes gene_type:complete